MKYVGIVIVAFIIIGAIVLIVRDGDTVKPSNSTIEQQEPARPVDMIGPTTPPPTQTPPGTPPLSKNKRIQNGMTIETTVQGTGESITNGKTAVVNYTGKFEDGKVFDSNTIPSFGHVEPFSFTLGAGQVIKGWDQGVLGMKVGETRLLTVPADLAYGASGIPGAIPGNATLIFEVTLTAIK